jgi:hypothetical protein
VGLRKGSMREHDVGEYDDVDEGERGGGVREQSGRETRRRGEDHVKPARGHAGKGNTCMY